MSGSKYEKKYEKNKIVSRPQIWVRPIFHIAGLGPIMWPILVEMNKHNASI